MVRGQGLDTVHSTVPPQLRGDVRQACRNFGKFLQCEAKKVWRRFGLISRAPTPLHRRLDGNSLGYWTAPRLPRRRFFPWDALSYSDPPLSSGDNAGSLWHGIVLLLASIIVICPAAGLQRCRKARPRDRLLRGAHADHSYQRRGLLSMSIPFFANHQYSFFFFNLETRKVVLSCIQFYNPASNAHKSARRASRSHNNVTCIIKF